MSTTDSERILLVDDEANTLRIFARFLGDEGYKVATARSMGEALEVWERDGADAVLTDHVMPGGSGTELMKTS